MEELLNKLIEKGWKPMGKEMTKCHREKCRENSAFGEYWVFNHIGENGQSIDRQFCLKIREIVSKNSGLWQFVCENGMLDADYDYEGWALVDAEDGCISEHETGCREIQTNTNWGYRLIESSLRDESELESFILDNIKV